MAFETTGAGEALLVGRALFAAVLGYLAVGNLRDAEETIAYAASKGTPAPRLTVPLASLALVGGALSILLGAAPLIGSLAVIGFLCGVTPVMHDFWNRDGMDRQNERVHFLKNVALAGATVVLAALSTTAWPYAVGGRAW